MDLYTPILEALLKHIGKANVPFHMPGHKSGKGLPAEFAADIARFDVTELPGLDDLHMPEGPLLEASRLAAEAFGAGNTYFLVNGSTCGILAAITAVCKPNDKILAVRDCHRSAVNAMMLAGAEPVYVKPRYHYRFGLTAGTDADTIDQALKADPDVRCVYVTRPNYYGVCCDIAGIARVAHSHGKLLLVDEAHGAHFRFSPMFPASALGEGADIVVQSAHKTLPVLTQGAFVHLGVNSGAVRRRLEQALSIFQTSSPSYPILASLDIARAVMQSEGEQRLGRMLENLEPVRRISGLRFLEDRDFCDGEAKTGAAVTLDPSRIVLHTADLGLTGFEAYDILDDTLNIQAEMADMLNVVFLASVSDTKEDIGCLAEALTNLLLSRRHDGQARFDLIRSLASEFYGSGLPPAVMGYRDAFDADHSLVRIDECADRICKDMLIPYPPGIPAVFPGERITPACAEYIRRIAVSGGRIYGLHDGDMVCVVKT